MKKLMAVVVASIGLATTGCPCLLGVGDCKDPIDVTALFWTAFRNPESFDAWLAANQVDADAPGCMRHQASRAFNEEQAQLQECSQMLTGSPAWTECHEEAEQVHNRGVILNDIARACDGGTRFDATEGGQYLIQAKSLVGNASWQGFADVLEANTPRFTCDR